jgi:hypothetical protein
MNYWRIVTMVELSFDDGRLILDVQGWDRLWALKKRLEIPLGHVSGVGADPEVTRGWKGIRMPGTYIPGVITAGTFYHGGKRVFWDVHDPDKAIVIDLTGERYHRLVVEVADPDATTRMLRAAMEKAG